MALGIINCCFCQKEFETDKKYINRFLLKKRKAIYCSKKCQQQARNKNIETRCNFCNKKNIKKPSELKQHNFCSLRCSAIFFNKRKKTLRYCELCNKQLISQKKYCSKKCETLSKKQKIIAAWLNGDFNILKGYKISSTIRNYLLEKSNFKCEQCGFSGTNPSSNKTVLEIHHEDGDYTNNRPENLKVLCPNCHAMTPTYRNNNKNGRTKRNKKI